jgi:SAM-dependent methyltransferase
VGIDFSSKKAAFAARNAGAHALMADATQLPFADGEFDVVLIRDLLHHVKDRGRVLAEARRVLVPGGRLRLIEPNALSPLIMLQAALVPAERGAMGSTDARLRRELETAGLRVELHRARQPLPLGRVLLHPRLPFASAPLRRVLAHLDTVAARFMPERTWTYLIYEAIKP